MDALAKIQPVIEGALVRMGQTVRHITAEDATKFAKPFDVSPQVHYLLDIAGQEAVLSIYYLGEERMMELVTKLAQASGAERQSGVAVAFHVHTFNQKAFFAHLTTGQVQNDSGLQKFLPQLFSHKTTGEELNRALSELGPPK